MSRSDHNGQTLTPGFDLTDPATGKRVYRRPSLFPLFVAVAPQQCPRTWSRRHFCGRRIGQRPLTQPGHRPIPGAHQMTDEPRRVVELLAQILSNSRRSTRSLSRPVQPQDFRSTPDFYRSRATADWRCRLSVGSGCRIIKWAVYRERSLPRQELPPHLSVPH